MFPDCVVREPSVVLARPMDPPPPRTAPQTNTTPQESSLCLHLLYFLSDINCKLVTFCGSHGGVCEVCYLLEETSCSV
jgi:hypothetical protein